jgi:hypothetical protein
MASTPASSDTYLTPAATGATLARGRNTVLSRELSPRASVGRLLMRVRHDRKIDIVQKAKREIERSTQLPAAVEDRPPEQSALVGACDRAQ